MNTPHPRRFWPFALVPLAALAWVGLTAHTPHHQAPWQPSLDAFRDDGSASVGESPHMGDLIVVRNDILSAIELGRPLRLTPVQDHLLFDCLHGPVEERSQSEALDALKLALRAGFLTPAQTQEADEACLAVLSRTPPPMVRLEGARYLAHSQDPRRIAALQLLLNDPDPKIRGTAQQILAKTSQAAPPKAVH